MVTASYFVPNLRNKGVFIYNDNKNFCFFCRSGVEIVKHLFVDCEKIKEAISTHERALCQLTVCFEFQSRSDRRKGHKSYALEMVFTRKVTR